MEHDLEILNPLFKGREDVFIIRWELEVLSGYSPDCHEESINLVESIISQLTNKKAGKIISGRY